MKSLIIYEVEHGETTDPITDLLAGFDMVVMETPNATFVNSTVRVDNENTTAPSIQELENLLKPVGW